MNCKTAGMAVKATKTGQYSSEPRTSPNPKSVLFKIKLKSLVQIIWRVYF